MRQEENPNSWSVEIRCDSIGKRHVKACHRRIKVGEHDLFIATSTYVEGFGNIPIFAVDCGHCGEITIIPSEIIPKEIQEETIKRYQAHKEKFA